MKVQEYLQDKINQGANENCALDILNQELGIKVKLYDDRVVLNYNQIESPKTDPIVMECRGLILSFPDFEVMARGFDRFFNFGEAPEFTEQVDFSRAFVYEKVDGSYVNVYHDGDKWCIATRGTAFAESENYSGRIFKDMILEAFGCDVDEVFSDNFISTDHTLIFEFTSPENRVVTRYTKPEMVLTAVRNRDTGNYVADKFIKLAFSRMIKEGYINFRLAKKFDISNSEAALQAARELTDLQEGYVVFDPVSQARVKIKSPTYVAVHHIRGEGLTPKRMAHLVSCGEVEEYLNYFPEDKPQLDPYIKANFNMLDIADRVYEVYKDIESQKDFAIEIKDMVQSPILFMARAKDSTPSHEFNLQKDTMKVKMLLKYMDTMESFIHQELLGD